MILFFSIMIVVALTSPAHAQPAEIYIGFQYEPPCPQIYCGSSVEIEVYQGQGQICWTAEDIQPNCTTSNTLVFFQGETVTFTATGINGYMFDHWITPDKDTYTVNPIAVTLPMPVIGNPMGAVFVKGTSVPEFSQALLMLGAAMILCNTIMRRSKSETHA